MHVRRLVLLMIVSGAVASSGSAALAGPAQLPAQPPDYGWSDVPRAEPALEDHGLAGVWSDGTDVWAVGTTAEDVFAEPNALRCAETCETLALAPLDPALDDVRLRDVDGTSAADVWVVGSAGFTGPDRLAVIQHFDGSSWTVADTAGLGSAALESVAAIAPDDVWAVGCKVCSASGSEVVLLHWDGATWTDVSAEIPDAYEFGATRPMPKLIATGSHLYLPLGGDLLVRADGEWGVALDRPADVTAVGLVGDRVWAAGGRQTDDFRTATKVWRERPGGWRGVPSFGVVDGYVTTVTGTDRNHVWVGGRVTYDALGNLPAWLLWTWDGDDWSTSPAPMDVSQTGALDSYHLADSVIGPDGRPWVAGSLAVSEGFGGVFDVLRRGVG